MTGASLAVRAVLCLGLLLLTGEAARAQSGSYSDLRQEYRALFQEGRYEEALPVAREALEKGQALFGSTWGLRLDEGDERSLVCLFLAYPSCLTRGSRIEGGKMIRCSRRRRAVAASAAALHGLVVRLGP